VTEVWKDNYNVLICWVGLWMGGCEIQEQKAEKLIIALQNQNEDVRRLWYGD
jgi:hypothetical protein